MDTILALILIFLLYIAILVSIISYRVFIIYMGLKKRNLIGMKNF